MKVFTLNRKAYHDYEILEEYEVGVVLMGPEVKSIKEGRVNLKGAFAQVKGNALVVGNMHVSPCKQSRLVEQNPLREKKLLLKRYEIERISGKIKEKGVTLVPLKLYTRGKWIKIELGLAKGKKLYDKREDIKKKDLNREQAKGLKNSLRF